MPLTLMILLPPSLPPSFQGPRSSKRARRRAEGSEERHFEHRHHTHYVPRDFDLSPYFRVVKPTLELDFDFHRMSWRHKISADTTVA